MIGTRLQQNQISLANKKKNNSNKNIYICYGNITMQIDFWLLPRDTHISRLTPSGKKDKVKDRRQI
jgi:hypothetical protein